MTRTDLIHALAERADLSTDEAERAVDALFAPDGGIIPEAVAEGRRVELDGFGRLEAGLSRLEIGGTLE